MEGGTDVTKYNQSSTAILPVFIVNYSNTEEKYRTMHFVITYDGASQTTQEAVVTRDSNHEIVPFGKPMCDQFLFADGWRNINHG